MAYDEFLADRIRQHLRDKRTAFEELNMMGGLCFMVDGKMLCGLLTVKKYGDHLLMARIGPEATKPNLTNLNAYLWTSRDAL